MSRNKACKSRHADPGHPEAGDGPTVLKQAVIRLDAVSGAEAAIARLNDRFRVVSESGPEPRQWQLQRRRSAESWTAISFCATREGLLLAIRDKCVRPQHFARRHSYPGMDPAAIAAIKTLPARFPRKVASWRALTFSEEAAIRRAGRVKIALRDEDGGRVFTMDEEGVARWRAANAVGEDVQLVDLIRASIEEGAIEPGFMLPNKFMPDIVMRASREIRQILARKKKELEHD